MKNLTPRYSFLRIWIAIAVSYLLLMVNANAASLEIHPSVLTALGKRPSFADKMIVIDDVGKGGVDYEFMVSQTQITVQDWVDFLNVVDPGNSKGLGLADSNNPHHHPYQYSGNWQVKSAFDPGGGFSYSRAVTAKLPIDKLSLNQVARYMNWLATGSIANGAFTFSGSSGNSRITAFDSNFPGARLPLDVDMVMPFKVKKHTIDFSIRDVPDAETHPITGTLCRTHPIACPRSRGIGTLSGCPAIGRMV